MGVLFKKPCVLCTSYLCQLNGKSQEVSHNSYLKKVILRGAKNVIIRWTTGIQMFCRGLLCFKMRSYIAKHYIRGKFC